MTKKSNIYITSAIWLILAIGFLSIRVLGNAGHLSWLGNAEDFVLSFVVQVLIMLCLTLALFSLFKKQSLKQTLSDFSFQKIGFRAILISIVMGVIVFVLNIFVANFFSLLLTMLGYEPLRVVQEATVMSVWTLLIAILIGCIFPAVCEEVSHRGLLLKGFEALGVKKTILISGLLFGFMHFDIYKFGYAFAIGCFLAYITLLSRSILPAIIVHFMNNFMVNYIVFSQSNQLPLGKWFSSFLGSFSSNDVFTSFLGVLLLVTGLGLMLFVMVMMLFRDTSLRQLAIATEELAKEQIRKEFLLESGVYVPETEILREDTIAMEKEVVVGGKIKSIMIKIPIKMFGVKINPHHKWNLEERVLFGACIFLGALVTALTFFFSFI